MYSVLAFQYCFFYNFCLMLCVLFSRFLTKNAPVWGFSMIFLPQGSGFWTFLVPLGGEFALSKNSLGVCPGMVRFGIDWYIICRFMDKILWQGWLIKYYSWSKIHKILGKFMDSHSALQILHYMISKVVQGGGGGWGVDILQSSLSPSFFWR